MSNKSKEMRSQMRQIVKELWPELVKTELYTDLQKKSKEELEFVRKLVSETLERIDDRQKTIQAAVLRELAKPAQAPVTAPEAVAPKSDK